MKIKLPVGTLVRAAIAIAAPILAEKAKGAILRQSDKLTQKKDR